MESEWSPYRQTTGFLVYHWYDSRVSFHSFTNDIYHLHQYMQHRSTMVLYSQGSRRNRVGMYYFYL